MANGSPMETTKVFNELALAYYSKETNYRGFVLSGGSRSSKTWSIIQFLITYCGKNNGSRKDILIARQQYSDLKKTVMKDFFEMLILYGIYDEANHTKSNPQSYRLYGNSIFFSGLDSGGAHGEAHDVIWINEAFEAEYDAFRQLNQRLREFYILDYNPCFTEHWINSSIIPQGEKKIFFSHSTMLDNRFLSQDIVNEILAYEPTHPEDRHLPEKDRRPHPVNITNGTADRYYWQVYGEGVGAQPEGTIYPNVIWIDTFPNLPYWYGMDFGYTVDPTTLVRTAIQGKDIYLQELLYEPIDHPDKLHQTLSALGIEKNIQIIADSSDRYVSPKYGAMNMVKDLKGYGWSVDKVSKTQDKVYWIGKMKEYNMHIVKSVNFKREQERYRWKTLNGKQVNAPMDKDDHLFDASLYSIMRAKVKRRKMFW